MVTSISKKIDDIQFKVVEQFGSSKDRGFFKEQILSRGTLLACALAFPITNFLDTAIGLTNSMNIAATLGKDEETYNLAFKFLTNARYIIADPVMTLLRAFNPNIRVFTENNLNDGNLTRYASTTLYKRIDAFAASDNFFKREISSRLTVVSLALCCVVARVFDFVMGLAAAFGAFITLGNKSELNNFAYKHLQITGVIVDLTACMMDLINPTSHKFLASSFTGFSKL